MEGKEAERPGKPRRPATGRKGGQRTRGGGDGAGALPELLRRAAALGLSGLFTTEEAIRKALGDSLPQEWVDFAAVQGDRTRAELLDRLVSEFGRVLENLDAAKLLGQLLDGRTVEVSAQIRFGASSEHDSGDTAERPPGLKLALETKTARPRTPGARSSRAKGKA